MSGEQDDEKSEDELYKEGRHRRVKMKCKQQEKRDRRAWTKCNSGRSKTGRHGVVAKLSYIFRDSPALYYFVVECCDNSRELVHSRESALHWHAGDPWLATTKIHY